MFLSYATASVFVLTILSNFFCSHSLPEDVLENVPAPSKESTGKWPDIMTYDFQTCKECMQSACYKNTTVPGGCSNEINNSPYTCYPCDPEINQYYTESDCNTNCTEETKKCTCKDFCHVCLLSSKEAPDEISKCPKKQGRRCD